MPLKSRVDSNPSVLSKDTCTFFKCGAIFLSVGAISSSFTFDLMFPILTITFPFLSGIESRITT